MTHNSNSPSTSQNHLSSDSVGTDTESISSSHPHTHSPLKASSSSPLIQNQSSSLVFETAKIIEPSSQAVSRVVEGQALILDAHRDEIRQLNEVGSFIWALMLINFCLSSLRFRAPHLAAHASARAA